MRVLFLSPHRKEFVQKRLYIACLDSQKFSGKKKPQKKKPKKQKTKENKKTPKKRKKLFAFLLADCGRHS